MSGENECDDCGSNLNSPGMFCQQCLSIRLSATPPGTEIVPEGTVDDLINVWASFLTGKATQEQVHAVIQRFTASGRAQKETPNAQG